MATRYVATPSRTLPAFAAALGAMTIAFAGITLLGRPLPAPSPVRPSIRRVVVPRTIENIVVDGELEEESWRIPGRTGPFRTPRANEEARPYSDARFLQKDGILYLTLYAADQDIRKTSDAFLLAFVSPRDGSILSIRFTAGGGIEGKRVREERDMPWDSGAHTAVDVDGTFDDPRDEDEEWVVEASIPLAKILDGARASEVRASIARCDTPKGHEESCGVWGMTDDGAIDGRLLLGAPLIDPGF